MSIVTEGTITKTEVLASAIENTRFDEITDIDKLLIELLQDMSKRASFLSSSSSGTSTGSQTIALPVDCAFFERLYLDSERQTEISFAEYLDQTKTGFAKRNGSLYIYPTPNVGDTYILYYGKIHPNTPDAIGFGEVFRDCINCGVTAGLFRRKQQFDSAKYWEERFERKLSGLVDALACTPTICEMPTE